MSEEGNAKTEELLTEQRRDEIHSKAVRAGKRTYFFDVKATRRNDYYLTITESKKRFNRDGKFFYEKHKLFLYKEDFEKFAEALKEVVEFIREANPQPIEPTDSDTETNSEDRDFTDVEFEDLEEENNA
ncbi:MAG: PUR family DNA/RNA-binding protein [Bacteroidales bacterium]|nr:PUR family DNA/RNA-binding protein [Bacteroidales bacterium]MBN2698468.1 PUR family DNA/RNA-binding protein [Bacteroidales bacterium]